MGQEAKIRVRLDLAGARGDLAGLYREMGSAPTIAPGGVPGVGAGAGGGGVGSPGAAGFAGLGFGRLFGLGAGLLGAGTLLRGAGADAASIGGGLTGGISESIRSALFGDVGATSRGQNRALDQVKDQIGLAIGLRGRSPEEREQLAARYQGLFDTLGKVEVAREQGGQAVDAAFKGQIAEKTLGGILGRLSDALDALVRVIDRIPGVG